MPRSTRVAEAATMLLAEHEASRARIELLERMFALICARFGSAPIEGLDPAAVVAWRRELAAPTRWQATQAFKQLTAWSARRGFAGEDPLRELRNPTPTRREFTPFASWSQIECIAEALPNRLALLPWLGAGCGLRPGELLGLSWEAIDLDRRELRVTHSTWRGERRRTLKTRASRRVVPMRTKVADALAATDMFQRSGLVLGTRTGGPLDLANVRRDWRRALAAAQVEPRRIYDLRHTYATWSLRAGVSIFQLARRMGTSVAMIDATYGHLAADAGDYERALLDAWD